MKSITIVIFFLSVGAGLSWFWNKYSPRKVPGGENLRRLVDVAEDEPNFTSISQKGAVYEQRQKQLEDSGVLTLPKIQRVLNSEGFQSAWSIADKELDEIHRVALQSSILRQMAEMGRAEEALGFVREFVGLGENRMNFIYEIFSHSDLSLATVSQYYKDFKVSEDRIGLLKGLNFQVMKNGLGGVSPTFLSALPDEVKECLVDGLAFNYAHKRNFKEAIDSLSALSLGPKSEGELHQNFVNGLQSVELKRLLGDLNGAEGPFASDLKAVAFKRMALFSPEWVISQASEGVQFIDSKTVRDASIRMVESDPKNAVRMLDSISGDQNNLRAAIISGLSQSAAKKEEFDTAWEWTEQIDDPELRKKVEGQIWGQEKKVIDASVK